MLFFSWCTIHTLDATRLLQLVDPLIENLQKESNAFTIRREWENNLIFLKWFLSRLSLDHHHFQWFCWRLNYLPKIQFEWVKSEIYEIIQYYINKWETILKAVRHIHSSFTFVYVSSRMTPNIIILLLFVFLLCWYITFIITLNSK